MQTLDTNAIVAYSPVSLALITASAALLGVILGGFITYFVKKVELAHQRREEGRKLKVARLEDLHERILLLIPMSAELLNGYMVMRARRSESSKELGEILMPSSLSLVKVGSLVKIHAIEFEKDLIELHVCWERMIDKCNKFLVDTRIPSTTLSPLQADVATLCRGLEEKIRRKVQSLLAD